MNKFKRYIGFGICLMFFAASFFANKNAMALTEDEIYKDLLINAMSQCYSSSQMYMSLEVPLQNDNYFANNILKNGKKQSNLFIPTGFGVGNNLDSQSEGTKIGCYELFLGDKTALSTYGGTFSSIFEVYDKNIPSYNSSDITNFLQNIGYAEKTNDASKLRCIKSEYTESGVQGGVLQEIGSICWKESDFTDGTIYDFASLNANADISIESESEIGMQLSIDSSYNTVLYYYNKNDGGYSCYGNGVYIIDGNFDFNKLASGCTVTNVYDVYDESRQFSYTISASVYNDTATSSFATYSMKDYTTAYQAMSEYLTGSKYQHEFTDKDKYQLYSIYLEKVYGVSAVSGAECKANKSDTGPIVNNGSSKEYWTYLSDGWCRIQVPTDKVSKTVSIFGSESDYHLSTYASFEGLLQAIYDLELDVDDVEDVVADVDDDGNVVSNSTSDCYNGDLESMSWILCPAESNLEKVDDGLMGMIDGLLQIDTDYYGVTNSEGGETAAYQVWKYARDLANMAMIIILLVIIFSQLTGYGIDNYGIKKMLPRLIVMAILINLSFIICQILIDLSNILGDSLNHMLQSIGVTIGGERASFSFSDIIGGLIAGVAGAGAAAGVVIEGITLVLGSGSGGMAIVIIVGIVVLLIALVAILMFFVSLALRIMIVVLFTAISPLAFACYVLPNTQKLFKSWWNVFKAALLVFPICGGLYGLSFIIRAIAFSGDQLSFAMAMVGLIASVLPFLLLPTLLKKSIAGLGIVGEKFNGIGRSLTGGLRRGLSTAKGTEAYKNRMDAGRANMNERAIKRLENRQKNGRLSDYQQRELGRRRIISEQTAAKKGEHEKYGSGEYTAEEIAEAARQNAYTGTGSKINQSLGKSDAIKAYEGASGALAETSRLAAAQGAAGQLGKTIAGNRAAETFKAENAARASMANRQIAQVDMAARNGSLSKITQANGYTAEQENLAKQLAAQTGNSLVGKTTADFLKTVRENPQLRSAAAAVSSVAALASDGALSSVGMRTDQIQKNIGTSTTAALNQLENATAVDEAGVAQVNREIALQRARASRVAQERKTWSDQLSRMDTNSVASAFAEGLGNGDIAQVGAAFETLQNTGNLPKILANLNNSDLWKNMSPEMRLELNQDMIKSGDVGMKLFAKYSFGDANSNFADFLSGVGDESMGAKIAAKGSHALDGQDKDTIDFLADNIKGLFGDGDKNAGSLAKQIISGYNATQDGNEKAKFLKMLNAFKTHGEKEGENNKYADTTAEFESAFSGAISAAALAKMDSKMIDALGPNVKTILSKQIAELGQPNNATLLASMSQSVKDKLGLG